MKKLILATLSSLAVLTALLSPSPAAHASPGCVTQKEFQQVKKGFKKKRVHNIFDTAGKRQDISKGGGVTFEIRSYRACTQFGAVSIGFQNGKLQSKSAVF